MTVLTIGRVGTDVDMDGVLRQDMSGNRMSFDIEVYTGVADALALRQQILGYVDSPDESFVPITWSVEPAVDGYYRVLSVNVGTKGTGPTTISVLDVEVERVLGYAAPLLELRTLGAVRTNTHTITAENLVVCVPDASKSVAFFNESLGDYVPFAPTLVRPAETGDVKMYDLPSPGFLTQFYCEPAEHYAGAATLYAGSSLRIAVGRQVQNDATAWRVSNGLFELEPVPGSDFVMQFRMWLDGAWTAWVQFTVVSGPTIGSRTPVPVPHSVTVMRNSPEEVVVRLLTATNTTIGEEYSPVTVDFSLKRGSRYVSMDLRSVFTGKFGIRCASFASATIDADSYRTKVIGSARMVVAAPQDILQSGDDVFPNEAGVQVVDAWSIAIGFVKASDVTDTAAQVRDEYFFAHSPKQSVVAQ